MFPVEIKDTDYALNPPAHCQPDHSVISKISHCKFPLRSNVQCDIANWRWYPLMYSTSWLPSYTNNCSQHQWVLNLMRFIIMNDKICIEIEHTNPCSCPENGVSRSRSITCGSLAFLTTLLGKDALLDSRSLTSYTLLAILATASYCLVVVVCS